MPTRYPLHKLWEGTLDKHVGFTGTRLGLSMKQIDALIGVLIAQKDRTVKNWLHHGDCVGADETAHHEAADRMGWAIHLHPPTQTKYRAYCKLWEQDTSEPPKPFRLRNQDIVDMSAILIVCPARDNFRDGRGGTVMTYNMAVEAGKPRIIIYPSGATEYES
jgi:hypothetical protein